MSHINRDILSRLPVKNVQTKPLKYYVDGIVQKQDLYILSEAITLLESEQVEHQRLSLDILVKCYPHRVPSFRLGITGSPGVGKSTFIDSVAGQFAEKGHKVGILTVDPSSTDGKGSILGDKTRMTDLVKQDRIFIRPSPSNSHLGGLNQFTFEAIILCEAAGMDRIFIETVGVGQSEVEVSRHTDATLLLVLPGSGDSLQGIKKGVLEKADLIIVNKTDGDAINLAAASLQALKEALHFRKGDGHIAVVNYSSITQLGREKVLLEIQKMTDYVLPSIDEKRKNQNNLWLNSAIKQLALQVVSDKMKQMDIDQSMVKIMNEGSPFEALSYIRDHISINVEIND